MKIGDVVRFGETGGSIGRIVGAEDGRFHVRWSYGQDVHGEQMTGSSRWVHPRNLVAAEERDLAEIEARRGWAAVNASPSPADGVETVICAAVRMPDGAVFRGHRHGDALHAAQAPPKYRDVRPTEQGFVTSRNRYVDRSEALRLQLAAGVPSADSGGYRGELFSEDLY